MKKFDTKSELQKASKKITERALTRSANSTSCFLVHEPKAPKGLSKFKKI